MKTWLLIAGMLVSSMLGIARHAAAGEYESGFGFGISVSDDWLVLTRDAVAANADAFLGEVTSSELGFIPPTMRRVVYERVLARELEVFYRRDVKPGLFVDNINVLMQPADLPTTPEQLERVCEILPTEFSKVFGRPIAMDECVLRERVGRRALYLQFDGALDGTTTLQYQLQRGRNATLIMTATVLTENLPRMLGEFEEMVASIRIH
jgi:hypothetical protein